MLREIVQNESVDAKEDAKVIKEFKQLLNKAYSYGYKNLESDWGHDTCLYNLDEVRDQAAELEPK